MVHFVRFLSVTCPAASLTMEWPEYVCFSSVIHPTNDIDACAHARNPANLVGFPRSQKRKKICKQNVFLKKEIPGLVQARAARQHVSWLKNWSYIYFVGFLRMSYLSF